MGAEASYTPSRHLCSLVAQGISSGELSSMGLSTCRLAIQESNQIGNYLIINYVSLELPGERQAVL